jgi:superfamily II DNA or RNA helicase
MTIIYSYTTKTYKEKSWYKVGETEQGDDSMLPADRARIRIAQQDSTSNPEPLELENTWVVPDWISDKTIHAQLKKQGCKVVRKDKDREWFLCTIDDVSIAINNIQYGSSRPNAYQARIEQTDCIDQAAAVLANPGSKFLINAKMRFGKTFTAYEIVRKLNLQRILVLTYKPAVDGNWREDIETHVNYDGWKYYSAREFSAENPIQLTGGQPEVLFASFQDFNDFDKKKWSIARHYHYDAIIIDEEHYGSKTDRAQESLAQLTYDRKLCVSGTPLKALMSGEFEDDEIYTWGYADEQSRKQAEKDSGWSTEVYRWLPTMKFHVFSLSEDAKKVTAAYSDDEGFTMTKMFGSDDGERFNDEAAVNLFLDQVFGIGAVRKSHSPLRSITANHQLWSMPSSVKSVSAMERLLIKRAVDYTIINASDDNVTKIERAKDIIESNDKTITLSCGRFNTGVTVPEWDMVMMLDDTRSPETYFQTIFRGQSPDQDRMKDECYVIDFNPQRNLELIYEFADITAKKGQTTQAAVREFLEFAPVLDHSGNKPVEITVDNVLNMIAETGGYAERFGSAFMVNWTHLDQVAAAFNGVTPEANVTIANEINDNDIVKGKNYEPNGVARINTKLVLKEERELRQRVITTMRRLPKYLYVEEAAVDNVDKIVYNNNNQLFFEAVGIDLNDFEALIDTGFIKKDRLNRAIMAFNQIRVL